MSTFAAEKPRGRYTANELGTEHGYVCQVPGCGFVIEGEETESRAHRLAAQHRREHRSSLRGGVRLANDLRRARRADRHRDGRGVRA